MSENEIARVVVDAAFQIHKETGPGLLERVYEIVLMDELVRRGLFVQRQVAVPICYKGRVLDEGFRADLVINDLVIVELKSIELIKDVHKKQLLTYLKLSRKKLGLLINFGESLIKHGITRVVNGL
ncbi:GxxExxY protein [Pontiella sp.]|uniref:GxxExxY protein n=1 Tax=Pontiella sp. TaxID=2837462 RepID=UPI003566E716